MKKKAGAALWAGSLCVAIVLAWTASPAVPLPAKPIALRALAVFEGCLAGRHAAEPAMAKATNPSPVGYRVPNQELAAVLPLAVEWAESTCAHHWPRGKTLDAAQLALAREVGVRHPEKIRVILDEELPAPTDPVLHAAAAKMGLLRPGTIGITLGYCVFIKRGFATERILSHEFRHVYQYETASSIAVFMPEYLRQIAAKGYAGAPLEIDARHHERGV